MLATIKNVSKQPVTLILDHPAFLNRESGWTRSTAKFASTTDEGARVVNEVRRSYPGTVTILPGQSLEEVHPAIQNCVQVPALLARKVLTITFQDDPTPEAKPSTAVAKAPPALKSAPNKAKETPE